MTTTEDMNGIKTYLDTLFKNDVPDLRSKTYLDVRLNDAYRLWCICHLFMKELDGLRKLKRAKEVHVEEDPLVKLRYQLETGSKSNATMDLLAQIRLTLATEALVKK